MLGQFYLGSTENATSEFVLVLNEVRTAFVQMRPPICQGQLGCSRKEAASTSNVTILPMDLWS